MADFDPLRTIEPAATISLMVSIDASFLDKLPLAEVSKVTFYKRDEITTDLICCDVEVGENIWTFHEELANWDLLIEHLQKLPGFDVDWFAKVSKPPFAPSETVAFRR